VIPEIDIWRVASLMLKRYGDRARHESARHAAELWAAGDATGEEIWLRISDVIGQLANTTPPVRCTDLTLGGGETITFQPSASVAAASE
jgi:hypothetical protein